MTTRQDDDDGPRYGHNWNTEESLPTESLDRDTWSDIERLREEQEIREAAE